MVDVVHTLSTSFVTGNVQVVVGATDHAETHGAPDFRPCLLLVEFLGVGFEPQRGKAITEFKGAHRLGRHHVEQGLDETATFIGFVASHLRQAVDVLAEAFRVLRPGGRCAVLDFNNVRDNPALDAVQAAALSAFVVPAAQAAGLGPQYEYLRPSIQGWWTGREQEEAAARAGFAGAVHHAIGLGLMGCLVAVKAGVAPKGV